MSTEHPRGTRIARRALRRDVALAVTVDDVDFVVWCDEEGALRSAPRRCPHLDADLAGAPVVGSELVCPNHGWAFDGTGTAFKRNERGRVDPKGTVERLTACDDGDGIALSRA